MNGYDLPLWHAVAATLAGTTPVSGWRDRVEETFAELFLLGERPTEDELRAVLEEQKMGEAWENEVVGIWRRRVRNPARQPKTLRRGCPWVRPFYASEQAVEENGLRPIPDRLADALAASARDYITRAETDAGLTATHAAEELVALTVRAVRLWARTRDAAEDAHWPSVLPSRRRLLEGLAEGATRTGQARSREYIEKLRRERDEEEARWRELGLLDENG